MFKKADIILAARLIIAGLAVSYALSFGQTEGSRLDISCGRHAVRLILPGPKTGL